jgi:hypothetical protein
MPEQTEGVAPDTVPGDSTPNYSHNTVDLYCRIQYLPTCWCQWGLLQLADLSSEYKLVGETRPTDSVAAGAVPGNSTPIYTILFWRCGSTI